MIDYDYEIQPEAYGYKVYAYNPKLCQRLNKLMRYPYGKVDFVAEGSEGIFKVDAISWKKAFRILAKYNRNNS